MTAMDYPPQLHQRGWFYEPDPFSRGEGTYHWQGRPPEQWDEGKDPLDHSKCEHCHKPYNEKGWCQCKEFLTCHQCFGYYGDDGRCLCDSD